jgi:glycosyltransferase involved in cell wall biosynthesis
LADRIALFFGNFSGGGVQRVRLVLAREFLARGLEVDLVVVNGIGELRSTVPENARIVDLQAKRTLLALPSLVQYLRTDKPKAILSSQSHHNVIAILAHWLSGRSSRLVVGEHHNIQAYRKDAPITATLQIIGARIFYQFADDILAVSKGVARSVSSAMRIPFEDIKVIYNPIVLSELVEKAREQADHPWFDHPQIPVLIAIGRLAAQKDFPTLLRAISIIKKTRIVRLLILGDGDDERLLKTIIDEYHLSQYVQLLGFIANPYAYLSRADLFVLSSRWEGFPNTLLEALACGVNVVSTNCPSGPQEMLENGRYGRLVPVGDPETLAAEIVAALDNRWNSEILKGRAADFSIEVIGQHYLNLLLGELET